MLACVFATVVAGAFTWALTSRSARVGHTPDIAEGRLGERPGASGSLSSLPTQQPEPQPLAAALSGLRLSAAERIALEQLYGPGGVVPLWLAAGRLTPEAREVVSVLTSPTDTA